MVTLTEVQAQVADLGLTLGQIDSKLNEVAAFIATLKAGVVTQAELDDLSAQIESLKGLASANLAEADALDDEPPVVP